MSMTNLTEIEVEIVTEKAVKKTLRHLGIDVDDPDSMREYMKDMEDIRAQRKSRERTQEFARRTIIMGVVGGALLALWEGIKALAQIKGGVSL